jgi:hypothetical protein
MTKSELIELGNKILSEGISEAEQEKLMELFDKNVPHPNGSNLFFYPAEYNSRRDNLAEYSPSVEEVVNTCLKYRSIKL